MAAASRVIKTANYDLVGAEDPPEGTYKFLTITFSVTLGEGTPFTLPEIPTSRLAHIKPPQLLIRYTRGGRAKCSSLLMTARMPCRTANRSLKWIEQRTVGIIGDVGIVEAGHQEQRDVWIMRTENSLSQLYDFMRSETPLHAETSVTVNYSNSSGQRFSRDFVLTSQVDGNITWSPGGIKVVSEVAS